MADAFARAPSAHSQMLGASIVKRLPGSHRAAQPLERSGQGLFLLWLAFSGLLLFAGSLLWQRGVWHQLLNADPTGITFSIIVLFLACCGWTGKRAWLLGRQTARLDAWRAGSRPAQTDGATHWVDEFLLGCAESEQRREAWLTVLGERCHGPHEMAWWFNGIQLKLGLLGKVIGFSILALQLGESSFDPSQSAQLLKSLTGGLGIALLTTMTGLTGNILLGLQLMRLDRVADALMADALALSMAPPLALEDRTDGHRPTGA